MWDIFRKSILENKKRHILTLLSISIIPILVSFFHQHYLEYLVQVTILKEDQYVACSLQDNRHPAGPSQFIFILITTIVIFVLQKVESHPRKKRLLQGWSYSPAFLHCGKQSCLALYFIEDPENHLPNYTSFHTLLGLGGSECPLDIVVRHIDAGGLVRLCPPLGRAFGELSHFTLDVLVLADIARNVKNP